MNTGPGRLVVMCEIATSEGQGIKAIRVILCKLEPYKEML